MTDVLDHGQDIDVVTVGEQGPPGIQTPAVDTTLVRPVWEDIEWHERPAAADYPGAVICINNLSLVSRRVYAQSDGAYWLPLGGRQILEIISTPLVSPADLLVNTLYQYQFPERFFGLRGGFRAEVSLSWTSNANNKWIFPIFGSANLFSTPVTTSGGRGILRTHLHNRNSLVSQTAASEGIANGLATAGENIANPTLFKYQVQLANAADVISIERLTLEWVG